MKEQIDERPKEIDEYYQSIKPIMTKYEKEHDYDNHVTYERFWVNGKFDREFNYSLLKQQQ